VAAGLMWYHFHTAYVMCVVTIDGDGNLDPWLLTAGDEAGVFCPGPTSDVGVTCTLGSASRCSRREPVGSMELNVAGTI
jgi:hypothetical protein